MPNENKYQSYNDIITLPNPTSMKHSRMSATARAAQFAPFAALTGHDEALDETARLTDKKLELSEEAITKLNEQIALMKESLGTDTMFSVIYFVPDLLKDGGRYETHCGTVRRIDEVNRVIIFEDKTEVWIDDVAVVERVKKYEI